MCGEFVRWIRKLRQCAVNFGRELGGHNCSYETASGEPEHLLLTSRAATKVTVQSQNVAKAAKLTVMTVMPQHIRIILQHALLYSPGRK